MDVHVLRVHEIENLLLQPEALRVLLDRAGRDPDSVQKVLTAAADRFAGVWILQHAAKSVGLTDVRGETRGAAGAMSLELPRRRS